MDCEQADAEDTTGAIKRRAVIGGRLWPGVNLLGIVAPTWDGSEAENMCKPVLLPPSGIQ